MRLSNYVSLVSADRFTELVCPFSPQTVIYKGKACMPCLDFHEESLPLFMSRPPQLFKITRGACAGRSQSKHRSEHAHGQPEQGLKGVTVHLGIEPRW